jgi:hypothetical protein
VSVKLFVVTIHLIDAGMEIGPVTVAERSKACTVFARSEAGIVGSNPREGMDVWCVYAFIVCLGRGLVMS